MICGFGRLGSAFAAQAFGVTPDIMTMAKALTNGVLPMGAVAVKDSIYDTVVDAAPDGAVEFFHGYTYSGNPASCAAGLATLDIYEKENLFQRAADMTDYFLDAVFDLQELEAVTDIRGYGMLAAFDIASNEAPGVVGTRLMKSLYASGLHVKFTGDCALIAPPLVAEKGDIDDITGILRDALKNL